MTFADKTSKMYRYIKEKQESYYGTQLLRNIKRQIQKSKI